MSSFEETIPMMKLSQPMMSCNSANSCIICGRLIAIEHLKHKIEPLLQRYWRRAVLRAGSVLLFSSHCSNPCADYSKAWTRPASGQRAMCLHISLHLLQLRQSGLLSSWGARNSIVPVIPTSTVWCTPTWIKK
jgi:hypothetical protein